MIRSEHMKSCLAAQIRFMLFKGPGSFKIFFEICGNLEYLKAYRLIPLTPPLRFHFTLPLTYSGAWPISFYKYGSGYFIFFQCKQYGPAIIWYNKIGSRSHTKYKSGSRRPHGLIKDIDTKAKYRQLNKLTCKRTLRQVFIKVYRLEIQSVMLVFSTPLVN